MNNQMSMIMATVLATVLIFAIVPIAVQAVTHEDDGEFVANPYCDKVPDDFHGTCHDRTDASEDTGLYTCNTGIHVEDWKDCKDASDD